MVTKYLAGMLALRRNRGHITAPEDSAISMERPRKKATHQTEKHQDESKCPRRRRAVCELQDPSMIAVEIESISKSTHSARLQQFEAE